MNEAIAELMREVRADRVEVDRLRRALRDIGDLLDDYEDTEDDLLISIMEVVVGALRIGDAQGVVVR